MRNLLAVIASFGITILGWGLYVPMLREGQANMSDVASPAKWRPFMCVGFAYFLIGVLVPVVLLRMWGERGQWTMRGVVYSMFGGALGALGALGIILAITFGGNPIYVAPLVFGLAPVVNSFLTIYLAGKMRDIGPLFLAGLVMVALGAVTVLLNSPHGPPKAPAKAAADAAEVAPAAEAAAPAPSRVATVKKAASSMVMQVLAIAMVALCWGSYGPTLHKGQSAMMNSRLRPLLCVGLAYFVIAVLLPPFILMNAPEASRFGNLSGTFWATMAGAAGAVGALGIIMAFNFGGKPVFVMPLIFGGAPVVATITSTARQGLMDQLGPFFYAGLILVIAGAAMVLVFAPKGGPHAAHPPAPVPVPDPAPAADPVSAAVEAHKS